MRNNKEITKQNTAEPEGDNERKEVKSFHYSSCLYKLAHSARSIRYTTFNMKQPYLCCCQWGKTRHTAVSLCEKDMNTDRGS